MCWSRSRSPSLAHADRLIEIARERRLVLQVGHQERFVFDAFGIFGRRLRPRSVSCVRRNPVTGRGEDVSVVFDLMIHDIDLVRRMGFADPCRSPPAAMPTRPMRNSSSPTALR